MFNSKWYKTECKQKVLNIIWCTNELWEKKCFVLINIPIDLSELMFSDESAFLDDNMKELPEWEERDAEEKSKWATKFCYKWNGGINQGLFP